MPANDDATRRGLDFEAGRHVDVATIEVVAVVEFLTSTAAMDCY
jgi:hypothetical protein